MADKELRDVSPFAEEGVAMPELSNQASIDHVVQNQESISETGLLQLLDNRHQSSLGTIPREHGYNAPLQSMHVREERWPW